MYGRNIILFVSLVLPVIASPISFDQAVKGEKSIVERHSEPLLPEFFRGLLKRVSFSDAPESTLIKPIEVLVRHSSNGADMKESDEQYDVSSEELRTRSTIQVGDPTKRSKGVIQKGGPTKRSKGVIQKGGPTKRSKGVIQKGGPTK